MTLHCNIAERVKYLFEKLVQARYEQQLQLFYTILNIPCFYFSGTLITEWKDGKARCDKLLECKDNWQFVADQLVKIMTYYGFDGWLINIENPVQVADT